jgi:hypothetical protein
MTRATGCLLICILAVIVLGCSRTAGTDLPGTDTAYQTTARNAPVTPSQPPAIAAVPAQVVAGHLSLPAPAQLPRTSSAAPGDRKLDGTENDATLPHARVFPAAPSLSFAPAGSTISEVAYATYHFDLPGYSGAGSITTTWDSLPAVADYYVGVADFASNSWKWFMGDPAASTSLPGAVDFLSPTDQVYIVILLAGTDVHALQEIDFGVDLPPVAVLHPQYNFADAGTTINFDASASTDDAGIAKYEWDLDGDGSFELDSGTDPHASMLYPLAANITVQLKVTDTASHSTTASTALRIDNAGYDETEPNNDVGSANLLPGPGFQGWEGNLGTGGYDGSSHDYYRFHVDTAMRVEFRLEEASPFNFQLALYNSTGTTLLRDGGAMDSPCRLHYYFSSPGDYILDVACLGDSPADYTLASNVRYGSGYDEVEPNNNKPTANVLDPAGVSSFWGNLGAGGYDGGTLDWYVLHVASGGTFLTFSVDYYGADINLDLALFNSSTLIASSLLDGDNETINYGFVNPGTYYLRCMLRAGGSPSAVGDYVLSVTDDGPMPQVVLTATPDNGTRPLVVSFDASGSTIPPGAWVLQYQWDLNGDHVAESVTGAGQPTTSATFYAGGIYTPKVRILLNTMAYADGTANVGVSGEPSETEPNNTYAQAEALPAFPFNNFYGDVGPGGNDGGAYDYYSFTLPNGKTSSFTLDYQPGFVPMGIAITSFDGTNETTLAQSADGSGHEIVQYTNVSGVAMNLYIVSLSDPAWIGGNGGYKLFGSIS